MGVRVALGARRSDVVRLVFSQGTRLVLGGLVLGVFGTATAARWYASMMYGVSRLDPIAYLRTAA